MPLSKRKEAHRKLRGWLCYLLPLIWSMTVLATAFAVTMVLIAFSQDNLDGIMFFGILSVIGGVGLSALSR